MSSVNLTSDERFRAQYKTERWKAFSAAFLLKHPICVDCGRKANTTHHLVYYRNRAPWDYIEEELVPICWRPCHEVRDKIEKECVRLMLVKRCRWLPADKLIDYILNNLPLPNETILRR
jgi:5-methylcytosine-specific restriction endonuclease McrA